ncbi:MAG: cellobiose phosphorylase [Thermoflexales bacterium]|nr:cellobiose phosphorylase [Thermoflexales bacterium]
MTNDTVQNWQFIDDKGTFVLADPHKHSYLYFPLVGEHGLISSITPTLHGDVKTGQNTFLTLPVSVEDLHISRAARNFWVNVEGAPSGNGDGAPFLNGTPFLNGAWSVAGNSAPQVGRNFTAGEAEQVSLEAGFLWHKITRRNAQLGLRAEITNFVPAGQEPVELMRVTLVNEGGHALSLTPTAAIPIYGRSADDLRDHRHVTSLLHRVRTHTHGVSVRPTLSFDERGHRPNTVAYAVLGAEGDGTPPQSFFPLVEEFIGEGGTLDWPQAVVQPAQAGCPAGYAFAGFEAMGALRFRPVTLEPGARKSFILVMAVIEQDADLDTALAALGQAYGSEARFEAELERNRAYWQPKVESLAFYTGNERFDNWMRWVSVQPVLRRLCGNSFLPYHDYGRGGRGWRDLWQDSLALLMMEGSNVGELLERYYAGVRLDGSNATIIGARPGEFKADRNNIPRVWMDHGAWPFLTTQLYVDQSGDLAFLLRQQPYFKDAFVDRARAIDAEWEPAQGTCQRTADSQVYQGTILEHLLIQHMTSFFNVGEHNCMRLEGADWNDGMDMATRRGESVAFTALYASNLRQLSRLVLELGRLDVGEVELAVEVMHLLDTLDRRVDYASPAARQERLAAYCECCRHTLSGEKTTVSLQALAGDLAAKADWLYEHLRASAWVQGQAGYGWFNGYYDDDGQRLEGDHPNGVRMTLSGQVFTLMGGIATAEQAQAMIAAADRYLLDGRVGGYRLNTDFGAVLLNMGRCFGFAFGHKENGAMFSHMAVMYAYALYERGFARHGYRVLDGIYQHCQDMALSRMYPGIPEYVNSKGRGMYTYLTGSASWYLLTMLTQAFGVKGSLGDLALKPRLVREQFDAEGQARIYSLFAGKRLEVVYHNPAHLDYGQYEIEAVALDGVSLQVEWQGQAAVLPRQRIAASAGQSVRLDVTLGRGGSRTAPTEHE